MNKNAFFSKKFRLLSSKNFSFVFQKPYRIDIQTITVLSRLNILGHPRIGFAIPKKYIKKAHERNRLKRLVRESFRLHKNSLPSMDFVFITKNDSDKITNHKLIKILEKLWNRYSI